MEQSEAVQKSLSISLSVTPDKDYDVKKNLQLDGLCEGNCIFVT